MRRNRFLYLGLACMVAALGLASRRYAAVLPDFSTRYAGDTLWAIMVFVLIGLVAPRWPSFRVALTALVVSYSVELSQLYSAPWIGTFRHTTVGGLVLGYGFLWSDVVCYTVGVAVGLVLERYLSVGDMDHL